MPTYPELRDKFHQRKRKSRSDCRLIASATTEEAVAPIWMSFAPPRCGESAQDFARAHIATVIFAAGQFGTKAERYRFH
jgi:hypothetical protein